VRCVGYLSGLSAEHKMLRDTCKQFADTHLVPHAAATDAKHEFPKAAVRCLLAALCFLIQENMKGARSWKRGWLVKLASHVQSGRTSVADVVVFHTAHTQKH
jgi:hypothetical protein